MIDVAANDEGAIYVVELMRPAPDGLQDKTAEAMSALFGDAALNSDYIDVIYPGMLEDMSLPKLIRFGYDMPISDQDAELLRGLIGVVVLVLSKAFNGKATKIDLPSDGRLVAILQEGKTMSAPKPVKSRAAEGAIAHGDAPVKKTSDAAMSGRIATVALLVMFFLVAVMIWIAG